MRFLAAIYFAVAVLTFGYAAPRSCAEFIPPAMDKVGCQAVEGGFAAAAWPFYWSWWAFSP